MKLYPYQHEGVSWLASCQFALLADEPGLGKSAQVVRAFDLLNLHTILIIPPATARFVWRNEIATWSIWGHKVNVLTSTEDRPIPGCVNVCNYDLLARGFEGKLGYRPNAFLKAMQAIRWQLVVADEAHYLKEQDSLRSMAILGDKGLNGKYERLWLVTGTPMPNHPGELWTLLISLGATELEYAEFIARYCKLGTRGFSLGKPIGANPATADELNKLLRKVMMRRYKQFVLPQLPPIRIDDFPVPEVKINIMHFFADSLNDKATVARKIVEQEEFVREIWKRATASDGAMNTMAMIDALEAIGPAVALYRRWLGAVKAASFLPILIDELETGALKKVVIFAHHKQVISFLKIKLMKYNAVHIDGSVSPGGRESACETFQTNPECRVIIGQNHSMGTAVTLTASHEVVSLEQDWVPAVNAQAIMRCHRIGQRNSVRARVVRLADTLDDYIAETLTRKIRDIVKIVDNQD